MPCKLTKGTSHSRVMQLGRWGLMHFRRYLQECKWLHMIFLLTSLVSIWALGKTQPWGVWGTSQRMWLGSLVLVIEGTQCWGHNKKFGSGWSKRMVGDAWEHWLRAPKMEEFPCSLAWLIHWSFPWSNYHTLKRLAMRTCGFGIATLACMALTMTSMSCRDILFLLG